MHAIIAANISAANIACNYYCAAIILGLAQYYCVAIIAAHIISAANNCAHNIAALAAIWGKQIIAQQ